MITFMKALNIGLLGKGRMGKKVAEHSAPHRIVDLAEADVWIDFSHGSVVLEHARMASVMGKALVIGTTGWESDFDEVKKATGNIGVIYSPNFSVGVHLFAALLKRASELFADYEAAGIEMHHSGKVDKPSGTAKLLSAHLDELEFSSVRCGTIAGQHSVIFDSDEDTVTLTHQAKSRDAFAKGALRAAAWIVDKKGFYTMDDFLCAAYTRR